MRKTELTIGDKVMIIEDLRDDYDAAGEIAVFEGEFPLAAIVSIAGEMDEYDYESWVHHPLSGSVPRWEQGAPQPEGDFWISVDNPRFVCADGSKIWGAESWWGMAEGAPPLAEARTELDSHKRFLRGVFEGTEVNE